MNGNNSQTPKAFIDSLSHPRKIELAMILLEENPTFEQCVDRGFNKIVVMEMAQAIKSSVVGMENFAIDTDILVETAPSEEATTNTPSVEQSNDDQSNNLINEQTNTAVEGVATVDQVDPATIEVQTEAQVDELVGTTTEQGVQNQGNSVA